MSKQELKSKAKVTTARKDTAGMAGQTSSCLMALESRIMYDAAGLVSIADNVDGDAHDVVEQEAVNETLVDDAASVVDLFSDYQIPDDVQPKELLFVDAGVDDYQAFVEGSSDDTLVIMLDSGEDGVARISEELSHFDDLDSIHIVSHGGPGSLQLGSGTLSLANLAENSEQVEGWGDSLSSDGDILLYGCDVAAGVEGKSFIDQLAGLTGGDVAASIDKTGAADLGGDWDLEYQAGIVGSYVPPSFTGYHGVLGEVVFVDSGQLLGADDSEDVAVADLDNDGDLDAVVANSTTGSRVYLNDGSGNFVATGENLGIAKYAALGDVNGDGRVDIYLAVDGVNTVWLNDGAGNFGPTAFTNMGSSNSSGVVLADLDGDFDLDAFVSNNGGQGNRVWFNDGLGNFFDSGQSLGAFNSWGVDLADLNGDTFLDAFVVNSGQDDRVYFNNGAGFFTDAGQALGGSASSSSVALGDIDGDGDADAYVTVNFGGANRVFMNDGFGVFADSGQALGTSSSQEVALVDLDGDADLDAVVANPGAHKAYFNNGSGVFDTNQDFGGGESRGLAVGDFDGDGDQDVFVTNVTGSPNEVWLNDYVPEVTSGAVLNYTENDGPSVIDPSIALYDFDDSSFDGATVQISSNYVENEDFLSFSPIGGITGVWNQSTATLTLSGTGSDTEYAAALASVTYENSSENPLTASRTISFTVNDGMATSKVATSTVNIAAVNDAPILDNSGSLTIPAITEDAVASPAYSMLDFYAMFDGLMEDLDYNDTLGLAINGADNSNGSWQYSPDGGSTWVDIGAVSDTSALLLEGFPELFGKVKDTADLFPNDLLINGFDVGPVALTGGLTNGINMQGAFNLANAINAVAGITGVNAELEALYSGATTFDLTANASTENVSFDLNGVSISATIASYSSSTQVAQSVVSSIEAASVKDIHAWVGNGFNGGDINSVVIESHGNITVTGLTESIAGVSGIIEGIYSADFNHNQGEVILIPTGGSYMITTSSGDDTILDLIGMEGGEVKTHVGGDVANDGMINVNFPLNKLRFVPNADFSGTSFVTFRAWDQTNALPNASYVDVSTNGGATAYSSAVESVSITVNPVNDAPVVTSSAILAYSENDPATVIDSAIAVSDVDSANLASAVVSISANYVDGEDVLAFTDTANITGAWDNATGTLTLSGADSVANYQAALASITYQNLSASPTALARTVGFTVNDGSVDSVVAAATVNVALVNDAPVVTSGGVLNYTEDDLATVIDAAIAVSDVDSADLAGAVVSISANYVNGEDVLAFTDTANITGTWDNVTGTLTLSGSDTVANYQAALASVTYQNLNTTSPTVLARTVDFKVNDGIADSVVVAATVNVAVVNDLPVVVSGGVLSYTENDPATVIDSAITVSDVDSADLTSAVIKISANYVDGEDVLAFTDTANITGVWDNVAGTLTLTGTDTVANYQAALASVTYDNLSINPSVLARTVDFTVNDGAVDSAVSAATISVITSNELPLVTSSGVLNYTENDPASLIDPAIVVSDPDNTNLAGAEINISANYVAGEDKLTFTPVGNISGSWNSTTGVLTLSGNDTVAKYQQALASVTYQNLSDNPSVLERTVAFKVNDGIDSSAISTSTVSVTAVNDAPSLTSSGILNYTENDPASVIDAGLVVSDVDNTSLPGALVSISSGYVGGEDILEFVDTANITGSWDSSTGVITLSGTASVSEYEAALRSVTYKNLSEIPDTATRTVSFQVNDGGASAASSATINVVTDNDAPLLDNSSSFAMPGLTEGDFDSDGELVVNVIGGLISDVDSDSLEGIAITGADNSNGQWQYSLDNGVSWISVDTVSADSAILLAADSATRIRFVPEVYFFGSASISYHAWDQTVGSNGETGVDATVNGGNTAFSINEAAALIEVSSLPVVTSTDPAAVVSDGVVADSFTSLDSEFSDLAWDQAVLESYILPDSVIDDVLFFDEVTTTSKTVEDADEVVNTEEAPDADPEDEEEKNLVNDDDDQGEVSEKVTEEPVQEVEEVLVDVAAMPQVEGKVVLEGKEPLALGARKSTTEQLAREKGFVETEQAEILKIFEEAFDLLQCD